MIIGRQTLPFGARRFEKTMQNIGKRPETQQKWQRYATPILNTYFVVVYYWEGDNRSNIHIDWKSKTKQRMVFAMIHVKDSLLPMGKVWSLDFQGIYKNISFNYCHVDSPTTDLRLPQKTHLGCQGTDDKLLRTRCRGHVAERGCEFKPSLGWFSMMLPQRMNLLVIRPFQQKTYQNEFH